MTDFRKTKIHIKSEEHSKAFQDAVFEAGGKWCDSGEFYLRDVNFIFVNDSLSMSLCGNAVFFQEHDYKEIQFPLTKLNIESLPVNKMTTFETAKIGDRVWSNTRGWAEIIEIDDSVYPLCVKYDNGGFATFTFGGYLFIDGAVQSLFWDEVMFEAPVKPMPALAIDAKVYVWSNGDELKLKRHFSHFKNGDCHTFDLGHTSWTGESTTAWDNWELAE